jgi:hypothetical protein
MSISAADYTFNSMSRPSTDTGVVSQTDMQSAHFADYMLEDMFAGVASDKYILFATSQPSLMASGTVHGAGLGGDHVDTESRLVMPRAGDRQIERLQLMPRPFITVPYLGRGSCDPVFETRLKQGESAFEQRSVSTMSEQSLFGYVLPPEPASCSEANNVEESAFNGWARGGASTREAPVAAAGQN